MAPPGNSRLEGLRRLGRVLGEAGKAWLGHRAQSRGAALAFYSLFSMAPILVLALALAGHVLGSHAAKGEVFAQLKGLLGPTVAMAVQSLVLEAHAPGSGRFATAAAFVLLGLGATSVFAELKDSLDEIWQSQAPIPSGFLAVLRTRFLALALVLILTSLLLLSMLLSAAVPLAGAFGAGLQPAVGLLAHGFSFLLLWSLFAVIFKMLPAARLSWGDAAAGALFTAILFSVGSRLIALYLSRSALASTFGAAGSLAALLMWVYYSAQILFLGAEVTREYALAFGSLKEGKDGP